MEKVKTTLAKNPFFKGLDQRYTRLILGCASNVNFDSGEFIFREGQDADQFYMIRQGNVALQVVLAPGREPVIIQVLGEGDVLGWEWLFPPYRWHFEAQAVSFTQAIALDVNISVKNAMKTITSDTSS